MRTFLIILLIIIILGCNDGLVSPIIESPFAIYVVEDTLYGKSECDIDKLTLEHNPLLNASEITAYVWSEHQITLPEKTYKRLSNRIDLWRKGFVITVEGQRIYWGLFQSFLDSYSCKNPVIILYPRAEDRKHILMSFIYIERSFHGDEGLENNEDPRKDYRIFTSLKNAGLLIQ